jgi:hypothetical protein
MSGNSSDLQSRTLYCDGTCQTDGTDLRRLLLTAQLAREALPGRSNERKGKRPHVDAGDSDPGRSLSGVGLACDRPMSSRPWQRKYEGYCLDVESDFGREGPAAARRWISAMT